MIKASLFAVIGAFLFYMEIKGLLKKTKKKKEILVFVFLMSLSIILLSLHFLDVKLPYVVEVADFITKPITEPLKNWLATFQQP